ncbi:MAG: alpha/beta hydrolase [Burkholderiaceae bacterium]|nr:alpha/beta hydrolase [Burkholderiaceae bacterium]
MSEPTLNYVSCPDAHGGHRMAYWQWGRSDASHVVLCVHGLSRQGRDFDTLARALLIRGGDALRVICPDVVGRGQSDWLRDPKGYQVPAYAADMGVLLQTLQPATLDWVGTSMGGLIGMALAGQPQLPFRIRKLVLNDVGPTISWQAIERIGSYLGDPLRFATLEEAAEALRRISIGFGPHTQDQWLALTRPMLKPAPEGDGRLMLHYDPAIAVPFRALTPEGSAQSEVLLWQLYDAIRSETLLLRGTESDLFARETAQAMTQRGPHARLVEFAGVGHAPTLVAENQVRAVCDFLLEG